MKNIIYIGLITLTILAGCQSHSTDDATNDQSEEQKLVQVMTDVTKEDINDVLNDLYEGGKQVTDVKLTHNKEVSGYERPVFVVVYEEK